MTEKGTETWAQKLQRLQREIAVRQAELASLVCGDSRISISIDANGACRRADYDAFGLVAEE
jgi:hypothetical protein